MNARHNRVSLHLALQQSLCIEPSLRNNIDYVICTACTNHQEKRKLYTSFFGICKTYAEFDAIFSSCTRDYSCIVLDQTQPSPTILNSIFYFKADIQAEQVPFKLCKPVFWKLHARPPPQKEEAIIADVPAPRRIMLDALS